MIATFLMTLDVPVSRQERGKTQSKISASAVVCSGNGGEDDIEEDC